MSGYSIAMIRRLLANYAALEVGKLPVSDSGYAEYWGPRMTKRGNANSPFEMAALMKSDLDRAIQQLPPEQKFIVLAVDIDDRSPGDCAYWLGKEIGYVMAVEDKAVRRIAGILSGKTDFRGGNRPGAGRKTEARTVENTF